MNIRRMVSFIVMLPAWPLAIVAALLDDEAEVLDVMFSFRAMWRRIYEK